MSYFWTENSAKHFSAKIILKKKSLSYRQGTVIGVYFGFSFCLVFCVCFWRLRGWQNNFQAILLNCLLQIINHFLCNLRRHQKPALKWRRSLHRIRTLPRLLLPSPSFWKVAWPSSPISLAPLFLFASIPHCHTPIGAQSDLKMALVGCSFFVWRYLLFAN